MYSNSLDRLSPWCMKCSLSALEDVSEFRVWVLALVCILWIFCG